MKNPGFMDTDMALQCSEILKALGHPVRLRLVDVLSAAERNVTELEEILGVKQAVISQQLKILRLNGLVNQKRRDGHAYYSLARSETRELLACIRRCNT